jgi:hypothetical protein
MSVKIQIRRGSASEWASANPTLAAGELGYDSTNDILKVGDGSTPWASLPDSDDQNALQTAYDATGQTFALGANVQAAIHAIDDELIVQDGRLDIVQGDANTSGSIAKAEADAKAYTDTRENAITTAYEAYADQAEADAKSYADAQIDAAKLALGTNFAVADIATRDALTGLTVGDLIFVTDDGDSKWAQYKVVAVTDGDGSTSTYEKIMDEDVYLNAVSASAVKTAYESNADTNAFTDALLSKLNAIEAQAKDDQNADEVPYVDAGQTYALGANVQAALYAVDGELLSLDGRLDTVEGDDQTAGSIAKALKDAKDYADSVAAGQDDASEISYDATGQTYALGSNVQAALYAVDDELIALDGRLDTAESDITAVEGRLDTIEGDVNTSGSIAKALQDAKDYADAQDQLQNEASEITYDNTASSLAATNVQAALDEVEGRVDTAESDITAIEDRLDIVQGSASTNGSISQAIEDAKAYADAEILLAKTALGTNFVVADIAARDALTDLTIGDNVFVEDTGNQRWAQFKVIDDNPLAFTKIMDQTILINAIDGPGIKAAYELNADTNAFTDALLNKLNAIEANAKDDQDADEVSYDNTNTGLSATNVQGAIEELYSDVFATNTANFVLASPDATDGIASFRALLANDIPNLSADKINSGTFGVERIPNLDADKINSGVLNVERIPSLDVAKITTGVFDAGFIPNLNADKINAGTLSVDRIPNLSADKISEGTLNEARIPTLDQSKVTNLTTDLVAKVAGPASATNLNLAAFDGTTGKVIADSGFSASSFARITIGAVEPTSPSAGDLWFNNDAAVKNLFFYDGTNWIGVNTYQ